MDKNSLVKTFFILVTIVCVFGFIWSFCVTRGVRRNSEESLKNQKVSVRNLILTETRDNKKYWELYSKKAEYDSQSTSVILYDIIGNFYNDENKVVLSFKSPKGIYIQDKEKVTLLGETVIVTDDNARASANKFEWVGKSSDIHAWGNVTVNRNNDIIATANEAILNTKLTKFKLMGNVVSKAYSKDMIQDTKTGIFK